jgi:RNA polymerase sigma-70 factor, ECF subfamily
MEESNTSYRPDANPVGSAVSDSLRTQVGIRMSGTVLEFQSIHDTFRPRILRYLTQLVGEEGAEDLTQTVMMKVSEGLCNFRGDSTLSTWIYRIATNTALDKLRSPSMRWTAGQRHLAEIQSERGGSSAERNIGLEEQAPSVEATVIRKEMTECLREFIDRLPETYKIVTVLSELQGLKNSEIAEILGISLNSVAPRPRETPQRAGNRMQFLSRRAK